MNTFGCGHQEFQAIIDALYWTNQIDKALMFYHDFYFKKKKITHWHCNNNRQDQDIHIDFHEYNASSSVIALLYIFQNEFENVYHNLLCHDNLSNRLENKDIEHKLEMNIELNNDMTHNIKNMKKGRNLKIITGKGTGNREGTSILRPWIRCWLLNECKPAIKSYIHPRNVGVLVLDSNDVLHYIQANKLKKKTLEPK